MGKLVREIVPYVSATFNPKQPAITLNQGTGEFAARYDHVHPDTHENTLNITAFAGGGQSNATSLTSVINHVSTAASAADSVKLPIWAAGLIIYVINDTATTIQVFAAPTQTINNVTSSTGVSLAAGKVGIYVAGPSGKWFGGALA